MKAVEESNEEDDDSFDPDSNDDIMMKSHIWRGKYQNGGQEEKRRTLSLKRTKRAKSRQMK